MFGISIPFATILFWMFIAAGVVLFLHDMSDEKFCK